jgi:hypothetical protein
MNKPEPIPTQQENPKGLHRRYIISKADGTPVDENAEYFVLRLDDFGKDPVHVEAGRCAILKYADAISRHLPELAVDLRERYGITQEGWPKYAPRPVPTLKPQSL